MARDFERFNVWTVHVISPPLHVYFQPLNKDLKWAKMKNDVVSVGGALYLGIERIYACQ